MKAGLTNTACRLPVLGLACILLLIAAGCQPQPGGEVISGGHSRYAADSGRPSRVSVFLSLKDPEGPAVTMELAALEMLVGDSWMPLNEEPVIVDAEELGPGQMFLGRIRLPAGVHDRLRVTVQQAFLQQGEKKLYLNLRNPVVELEIPSSLRLESGDSESLFITWDTISSLQGGGLLVPAMFASLQSVPLIKDLAYVACPEIDTVYVIRTDRNWVIGSLGIPGRPMYLGVDFEQDRLYILAAAEATVKVVELTTGRIRDSIRIPMTTEPSFMSLSSDYRWAYILDPDDNNLVKLDLDAGVMVERVDVGFRPSYLRYLAEQNRLALSSANSHRVHLLDPESLATLETIAVGNSPDGLLAWEDLLYIAESGADSIAVYDLSRGHLLNRLRTGASPRRLLAAEGQIYSANHGSATVTFFLPGQLSEAGTIPVGSNPLEMAASEERHWLYVGDERNGGLTVIDLTTNRPAGYVDFGARPKGIVVIQ